MLLQYCHYQLTLFLDNYNFTIKMKRQRPQRQSRPQRNVFAEQKKIQDNTYHMKEILKSDIAMLEEENAWLKLKCKNMAELEEKVEIVLKQNAQLLSENQKMSRYMHQQKTQNEMLKNKCENLNAQKYQIADECQKQKMKLLKELENLQQQLADMEELKSAEIKDIQQQYQMELQTFKRQFSNSENAYELQIRRLNDELSKREKQLRQYGNRFKKISTETDYDMLKLKQERDQLRKELIIYEKDHIEQLEELKAKLQSNRLEQIQAQKRLHLTNLEEARMENNKLRDEIDGKNREIQQIGNNLGKQRIYYQDSINLLKKDIESYRQQLIQTDKIGRNEIGELKQKLQFMHDNEIKEIQANQSAQIRALEEEISKMQMINRNKNLQIEKLIKQKSATFNYYDSEVNRGKDEYSVLLDRFKDMDFKYSESLKQATNKLIQKEKHITYLQDIVSSQKNNAETDKYSMQTFIQNLKQELSNEKIISKQKEQALKEEASSIRHQLNQSTLLAEQRKIDYQRLISELKTELSGTSTQLNTKSEVLISKIKILEKQNEGLKNNIALKDKELKNMVERLKASTERESKLAAQIDQLRSKMIKKDQKSNEAILQQKVRMQNSFAFTLDNLKNDHEAALRLEYNKHRSLQQALKKKEVELNQLLLRYKRMTDEIQILTEQQANKKDITLKFPGATSDLIATKNIFDVYLKAKILDVCGDALKQNRTH